jgi:hypothetical protein
MPITPEEAQKLSNLQRRMLANIAADKPSHDGLTKEEIKEALDFVRSGRASAVAAGEKATAKKTRAPKAKSPGTPLDLSSFAPGVSLD